MTPADISVVIPVIDEQSTITRSIHSAKECGATQIIVVDGGSKDDTVRVAAEIAGTTILHSPAGRGIQLNRGAAAADREFVLFLHADNWLDKECLRQICEQKEVEWGAFCQRIDSPRSVFRAIEWGNRWRVRHRRIPFGDQAIFVRRAVFDDQGGFADVPLMEDIDFARRMRRYGKPRLLSGPVVVSPRRWNQNGVVRQTARNWMLQVAYALGVRPETLQRHYR